MAKINIEERHVTLKLVYCGPPLAGKTTNLEQLHALIEPSKQGRLMLLGEKDDRTLFFDLLPLHFRLTGTMIRLKVYTVPGQAVHQMTRRVVLREADGVAFVADSSPGQGAANDASFKELLEHLRLVGLERDAIGLITEYNKRDVDGALAPLPFGEEPVRCASARAGEGVIDTFLDLAELSWKALNARDPRLAELVPDTQDFRAALAQHVVSP